MSLIDLVPGVSYGGPSPEAWEAACEIVDSSPTEPFSEPRLARDAGWKAARYLIRAYLALGFIERISPPKSRPVYYRVTAHALPNGRAA